MKRALATGVAVLSLSTVLGVSSASAAAPSAPVPCATYPAGQTYSLTEVPTSATIESGANIKLVAVLSRGAKKTACAGYLIDLRYASAPAKTVASGRTTTRGVWPITVKNVTAGFTYFFAMNYQGSRESGKGVISLARKK